MNDRQINHGARWEEKKTLTHASLFFFTTFGVNNSFSSVARTTGIDSATYEKKKTPQNTKKTQERKMAARRVSLLSSVHP